MNNKPQTLPFLFVLSIVSLYGSMTCSRLSATGEKPLANAENTVVITRSAAAETPVTLANAAPIKQDNTAPLETATAGVTAKGKKSVVAFLAKLRQYQLSWAQFPIKRPDFLKAIYLTNGTAVNTKSLRHFIAQSKKYGINSMVIDAQGKNISTEQMSLLKTNGIYPIGRVVVFDLGLKQKYPDQAHLEKVLASVERAAKSGYREIQLDYIRYADRRDLQLLPLKFKYDQIGSILARMRKVTDSLGVELGADVFGRITINRNDHIGQKLEVFGEYVHNLYPMVYPSHYYGDPEKIADPYGTVKEGVENSKERIPKTRIIPYIQGFGMKIKPSGLALPQYVLKQFFAVDDAQGDGYVVWNARNDYSATWKALQEYDKRAPERKKNIKVAKAPAPKN